MMGGFLKQSTAATIKIGPFLDKTDGVSEETGLAGNGTEISKAGGAFGAGPTLGTHDAEGWYPVSLTSGNTDTLGTLTIKSHDSATHLPVWHEFTVLPANAYDSLVGGTDTLQADVTQCGGSTVAAGAIPNAAAGSTGGTPINGTNAAGITWTGQFKVQTGVVITNSTLNGIGMSITGNGTAAGVSITGGSGATGNAVDLIAASTNGSGLSATGTGSGSDILADITGNLSGSVGSVTGAVGSVTGNVGGNVVGSVASVTGAVGSVTGNVGGNVVGSVASVTAGVTLANGAITNASLAGNMEIVFETDFATNYSTTLDRWNTNVVSIESVDATDQINAACDTALADYDAPTNTEMTAAFTEIKGATWSGTTDTLEAIRDRGDAAWTTSTLTDASIADQVWDEVLSGHLTAGSTGNALNAAGSAGDPWSTAIPGAYGAGTAGYILGNNLDAAITSRSSHAAADVWSVATRQLTATQSFNLTGNITGSVSGSVGSISGVTFPTNFGDLAITVTTGLVSVGTNNDKTGYSISGTLTTLDALDTAQDTQHSTTQSAISALNDPTAAAIADAVWDEALSGHLGAGSTGEALNAAGAAGDPWTTSLPGSYTGSQAGKMLSDILTDTAEIGAAGAGLTGLPERGKYALGSVWIGPSANTNTTSYVDGIITNPVSTIAAAKTIADALKLRRFYTVRTGTSQIGADMVGYEFSGDAWSLTTTGGSRDVSSSHFYNAKVIGGTYASTSAESHWSNCEFSTGVSVAACHMEWCTFAGTLTLNAAGNYDFIDCASVVAGTSAPVFSVPSGTVNISFRRWSGGITINGITSGTTVSIDMVSGGTVTLNGADGNVQVRGLASAITDNRTGSPTLGQNAVINITKINTEVDTGIADAALATAAALATVDSNVDAILVDTDTTIPGLITGLNDPTAAAIADAVWDELIAGHTVLGSTAAAVSSILTDTGTTLQGDITAILADTNELQTNQGNWLTATSVTVSDKTGFSLASTGLDLVVGSAPTSVPVPGTTSIVGILTYLCGAAVYKSAENATTLTIYQADGVTPLASSTVTWVTPTFTRGAMS